jgi:GNAT superfamily N-acetyltransferase
MRLASEVEPLFGPMVDSEEFSFGIKECIRNRLAYGIENENCELAGIIAIDRGKNEILWLVVGMKFRGKGYGYQLVQKAVEELEDNGDIYVQTFSENIDEGKSARMIYKRNGFTDLKEAGKNPAGIDTVIMVRKAAYK